MGSFKGNGRNSGSNRRRANKASRRRGFLFMEPLEERRLLAAWHPTNNNIADVRNGPMANEGQDLINVFEAYLHSQGNTSQFPSQFPLMQFKGGSVFIGVNSSGGDFNTFKTSLTNLGMQITNSSAYYGLVEGYLPISQLTTVAAMSQTLSAHPNYKPHFNFVGAANNEAETSLFANVARTQFGVDGTGVTVGVLSDSVGQVGNGLADSVGTGDLPNNVKVIQDGPAGSTDEGRAMLENVHDIAPGAALQFATADATDLQFAQNIQALAAAGSNVIVDDVAYLDEPLFQDGLISQAVDNVTSGGVSYFSSARNESNMGYLSQFRAASDTVGTLGAGTYMNFNPNGGVTTQLPVTIGNGTNGAPISSQNPATLIFQFDQPFKTQQPASSTAAPTSEVDFYVLDSGGNVVASSTNNNVATGEPIQIATVSSAGNYFIAMKLVSGPAPGHVEFLNINENTNMVVSNQFGSAGGTFYPSTGGHNSAQATIGVGAVPWWAPAPYLNQTPLANEQFSSFGPALSVLDVNGNPLSAPVTIQNPTITAPDGGNTSFFPPGGVIDTSNPPFPGEPSTSTNLSQNLPSFFGTSSAAPNAAAVAALMLQKVPNLKPSDIRSALITSASAMNGTAQGTWDPQAGFGMINAVKAINAADVLRVDTTSPGNGVTVTTSPSGITFKFNKQVDFSTVKKSALNFTSAPAGVTVTVQDPIAIDNPTFPTQIEFPFSIATKVATQIANGNYAYTLGGTIASVDTKPLASFSGTFKLNDTTAPTVVATAMNGRVVSAQFSEAMRPSSITPSTVFLAYVGPNGDVNLNTADARAKLTYDPVTFTVKLDYSGLSQTEMPSGNYKLVILGGGVKNGVQEPSVLSNVGNKLNGAFSGQFPSGVTPTKTNPTPNGDFVQPLGPFTLQAPVITSFQVDPAYDTGIPNDNNTSVNNPWLIGQVSGSFPGSIAGLPVYVEFNTLHGGNLDLAVGGGGRGTNGGHIDVGTVTNADGTFRIQAPFLPEGFQRVSLVVVGQPDAPPLPGLASSFFGTFRIDLSGPQITGASLAKGGSLLPLGTDPNKIENISSLTTMSLNAVDVSNPATGTLATPGPVLFPALNPGSVANVSNYTLYNMTTHTDESSFIATATFVSTNSDFISPQNRVLASDPYFGRIDLTFLPGLPQGQYELIARTAETSGGVKYSGITDAAGNVLNDTSVTGQGDFVVSFNFQSQPTFVTGMSAVSSYQGNDTNGNLKAVIGGPRSYYEEISPSTGTTSNTTLNAPPNAFVFDFSNALATQAPNGAPIDFSDAFQLIRSANTSTSQPDGDFGNLGIAGMTSTGNGFTRVPVTVTLYDPPTGNSGGLGIAQGSAGFDPLKATRVVITTSGVLPADYYKIYAPNVNGTSTQLYDVYGNQFDGEFLGNQDAFNNWKDLLPNGQQRSGLSGDGVQGGDFMTGFVVAPFGNIIYARPGYRENPLEPSTESVGTLTNPYSVIAPQAAPGSGPANPSHDPNGGQNATSQFFSFDPRFDRAGIGTFARSAFYAASQLSFRGPVVVIGLPGIPTLNPVSGTISTPTFVLQAPAGSDPVVNDGSASVPFDTTFVLQAGAILKMQNSSLFVQNQGSAFQALGGSSPSSQINITSYANAAIGGATDPASSNPRSGDFGGIVYRSIDQAAYPSLTFPIDGTLQGPNGTAAVSGENDSMSIINNTNISYGGGSVPQTIGVTYGAVTLYNSRPALTNLNISKSGLVGGGNTGAAVGAITADLDSFRADDTAMGALIRNVSVVSNGLNGIWLLPEFTGVVEPTNAIPYQDNPVNMGGTQNYVFNAQLPFLLTSRLDVGRQMLQATGGTTVSDLNRLSILPGQMLKFQHGAGIQVLTPGASLIVGDQTYIHRWDLEASINPITGLPQSPYSPAESDFVYDNQNSANVVFTSLYDNLATTTYIDPNTGLPTTIVPAIDSANSNGAFQPIAGGVVPDQARWGSITYFSGAYGVFNNAVVEYAGGAINIAGGTVTRNALSFLGATGGGFVFNGTTFVPGQAFGTRVMVTNNMFHDNVDTPVAITPDGLLAADPLTPLTSGHFFMRNNVMINNTYNGLGVLAPFPGVNVNVSNLDVNSVWDLTDVTYFLRGSIVLASTFNGVMGSIPTTEATIPTAGVTLTLQSALPNTALPNGQSIPKPGEQLLIKLMNQPGAPAPLTPAQTATPIIQSSFWEGAGFIAGVDNGVDPSSDSLLDPGINSQLRIMGIGGNETTGQTRIPVVITSAFDNTVGTTVQGVKMFQLVNGSNQAPAAGDGGVIAMGGNSLTNYNLLDPRQGNIIENADIRYISHIEVDGGGITDTWDVNGDNSFTLADDPGSQKIGTGGPRFQYNAAKQYVIADSNLANFRDAGVVGNASFNMIAIAENYPNNPAIYRAGFGGAPYHLFMYNNSIANMPTGVLLESQNLNNTAAPSPEMAVFLNNTFYNDAIGIDSEAPQFNGQNSLSHVTFLAMDNIFSNSTTAAINIVGMDWSTQGQYNLFWQNGTNVNAGASSSGFPNNQPIFGNPQFRNPAGFDFGLLANSAAIDESISEFGPTLFGDMLYPIATQVLNQTGAVRNTFGNSESDAGGLGGAFDTRDVVTLPGYPIRDYTDSWVPVLSTDPTAVAGPESNAATWSFAPLSGERDLLGNLRQKDPNSPNVGFGSRPYFDIGAYEYRQFFPPHVTAVNATIKDPANPNNVLTTDIYAINGVAGVNQTPQTIQFKIDEDLAQNTINGSTILLEGSGGTGIFNGSQFNKFYSLAGKVAFDPSTDILTVNLAAAGLTLSNDEYRLILLGTGSTVITDPEGNALDGQNTLNDDPNNPQLALPSGTGFPGSNFFLTFIVNDQGSSLVKGSLKLDPKTDTHALDGVTFNPQPSFTGTITDPDPAIDPLGGQTVIVDVSTKGIVMVNGQPTITWDQIGAGSATTNAQGQFSVQLNKPLPDSQYNVGPNGLLNSPLNKSLLPKGVTTDTDDSGYTYVRIRVIDAAGNASNLVSDSLAAFQANGAVSSFVLDTKAPHVTSFLPKPNSLVSPNPTTGKVTFTLTVDKNIDLASLTSQSVKVTRAGKDGVFGTADDVAVAIDGSSFKLTPLKTGALGPERLTFTISQGLVNDQYKVTLLGTGNSPVVDIAGNALDGGNTGKPGSDYSSTVVIYNPNAVHTVFVGGPATVTNPGATAGTRANPFPTIQAGVNAATTGDIVAVLPGVYTENVTLKALVRVRSASLASTDGNWLPGNALATVIRAPGLTSGGTSTGNATVTATNISSVPGLDTEIEGFTISSPLLGDAALGAIDPTSIGLVSTNSNILIDKNYFVDSNNGVQVIESGLNPLAPRINDNVFAGNTDGLFINGTDPTLVTSLTNLIKITNNDFVFNTVGIDISVNANPPILANSVNNIFWANHDLTPTRTGAGIIATAPDAIVVRHSLFQSNGASDTNASGAGINVGNGFNALALGPVPDSTFGNYTGNPAFVSPRDPRPGSDGPASFFLDANFDLTLASAAIDGASQAAPGQDLLHRSHWVEIPGHGNFKGFGPGFPTGPSDVGAFEFQGTGGTGGTAVGGSFRVTTDSLSPTGKAVAGGAAVNAANFPKSVTITFSNDVNRSTLTANKIQITGSGINSTAPLKATSLTWIDSHTVRVMLSGYVNSTGSVAITIPGGTVKNTASALLPKFKDTVTLFGTAPKPPAPPKPVTPPPAPAPAPSPTPNPGRRHPRITPVVHHTTIKPAALRPKVVNQHIKPGH